MRHGLKPSGVRSFWTSVVRYVGLCAAARSGQDEHAFTAGHKIDQLSNLCIGQRICCWGCQWDPSRSLAAWGVNFVGPLCTVCAAAVSRTCDQPSI